MTEHETAVAEVDFQTALVEYTRLQQVARDARVVQGQYAKVVYPVGCQVEWQHGQQRRLATVLGINRTGTTDDTLWVRSHTGKDYQIGTFRVVRTSP